MKFLLLSFLVFACSCGAAADTIIGPFEAYVSFDPPDILLNSTSGEFNVGVNLDWSWVDEITWSAVYSGGFQLVFLDAMGNAAPQFFLPFERPPAGGDGVSQYGDNFSVLGKLSYVTLHFQYDGLPEGSYFIGIDPEPSGMSANWGYNDSAFADPIAEPLRITVVPEPCTLVIAGMGLVGLAWARRRLRGRI